MLRKSIGKPYNPESWRKMVRETIPEEVSSSLKPVVDLELAKFGMS
jgi:hypothetical protein